MVRSAMALLPVVVADEIIGGTSPFRYQYMSDLLQLPENTDSPFCHGVELDDDLNIYLTYKDNNHPDRCLVKWTPPHYQQPELLTPDADVCKGTVHGLRIAKEPEGTFFYHANNEQALYKTTLDGKLVWSFTGLPSSYAASDPYKPTWFGVPPAGDYLYMADGYGSSRINLHSRKDGAFLNITYGGKGTDDMHFQTCHAISFDPRSQRMVVSDRENHRLVFFDVDTKFQDPTAWKHSETKALVDDGNRPCMIRFGQAGEQPPKGLDLAKHAIVAELDGEVHVLDEKDAVVSTIDVRSLIGVNGSQNPHDAMFMPNGDMVVATWNPGRISYWKRIEAESMVV